MLCLRLDTFEQLLAGVLISHSGLILTNAHLLASPSSPPSQPPCGQPARQHERHPACSVQVTVVAVDKQPDSDKRPQSALDLGKACTYADNAQTPTNAQYGNPHSTSSTQQPRPYPSDRPRHSVHRTQHVWLTARVVYVFGNHLDLAVLQLEGVSGLAAPLCPVLLAPPEKRLRLV
jgi:hypothetical protein